MAKFFSADLHVGEKPAPGNPSYYRPDPPDVYQKRWLDQCYRLIQPTDELYLVGDLAISLEDLDFYLQLPKCQLTIIYGNKEKKYAPNPEVIYDRLQKFAGTIEIITDNGFVDVGMRTWRVAHRPQDLCGFSASLPSLCGHAHGFWRTRRLSNGEPIINVGVDAWNGALVTEKFIDFQYNGVKNGRFNKILDFETAHT